MGVAELVAVGVLGLLAEQRRDELVAAHADVAVDLPDRRPVAMLAEGAVPGDRVLVVGVDQGAVDVEHDRRLAAHQATASSVTSSEISSSERFFVSGNRSAKKMIAATPKPA